MEKYQQYVNSGFEWIGDIPVQWNNLRLRFVCEFRNGYTPSKANPEFWEDGTIPWYRMEDIRDSGRNLEEAKQYVTKDAIKGGGLFEAGSFILATTATIGEHAVLIVDSLANQQFTNLKIRKSLSNRLLRDYFFYYLFVIDDYCKATTKTSTFPAVSMELLKNCHVVFPLVQEQQAIVDYLDKKCSEIDNVISAQQKRIALLQELKQSVITHAVTKGLNPNVEMKDSGVEWIGEIPSSWNIVRLKSDCSLKGRIGWNGLRSEEFEKESYAYLVTGQDFISSDIDWSKCYQSNKVRYDEDPCIQLENGDLLIRIDIEDNKIFKLYGCDLCTDLKLTPWEAALGTRIDLKTIDGETKIYIPQGVQSGDKIKIPSKGYKDGKGGRGDLVAEVKIMVPKKLELDEKEMFERLKDMSTFNPRND